MGANPTRTLLRTRRRLRRRPDDRHLGSPSASSAKEGLDPRRRQGPLPHRTRRRCASSAGLETGELDEAAFEPPLRRAARTGRERRPDRPAVRRPSAGRGDDRRRARRPCRRRQDRPDLELVGTRHLRAGAGRPLRRDGDLGRRRACTSRSPEIYLLACERLGVEPGDCVFVDDLRENVTGAEAVGMTAILHRDSAATVARLEELLGSR